MKTKRKPSDVRNGTPKGIPGGSKCLKQGDEVTIPVKVHTKTKSKAEMLNRVVEQYTEKLSKKNINPVNFRARLVKLEIKNPPLIQCKHCLQYHASPGLIVKAVYRGREDLGASRKEVAKL